jgi:pantoate kinase
LKEARAFCPGHITGFFQIFRHDDPLRTGSRGAGFSIRLGAESRVIVTEGTGRINVHINGARSTARVTDQAIKNLLGDEKMDVDVLTSLQLPISQGFGMSAAGALSAALALSDVLGRGKDDAYEAAHRAEVCCSTGLGDIPALRCGGAEFRRKEGLQPHGEVVRIPGDLEMVLARVGPIIDTSTVILDEKKVKGINMAGERCIREFSKHQDVHELVRLSSEFMRTSGLMTDQIERVVRAIGDKDVASMCMVGNSVFATGPDLEALAKELSRYGAVFQTGIDLEGPRAL